MPMFTPSLLGTVTTSTPRVVARLASAVIV